MGQRPAQPQPDASTVPVATSAGDFFATAQSEATRGVLRIRRLQSVQLAVLAVICASLVAVALLFGRAIRDARADAERSERIERQLLDVSAQLRQVEPWSARYRSGGADGRMAPAARRDLADAQTTLRRLAREEQAGGLEPGEAAIIASTVSAFAAVADLVGRDGSGRRASAAVARAEAGLGDWLRQERGEVDRFDRQSEQLTGRLTAWLVALIGLLSACGLAVSLFLELARRRVNVGLQDQIARQAALVGSLQDGFQVLSPRGAVLEVNQRLCEMLGRRPEELVGQRMPFLQWPEEEHARMHAIARHVARKGHGEFDVVYRRPDGERFPAILGIAAARDASGAVFAYVETIKDTTERNRDEAALAALAQEQTALHRLASAVAAEAPLERTFGLAAEEAARLVGVDHGVVVRFDASELTLAAYWGRHEGRRDHVATRLAPAGGTASAQVSRTGRPARVEDLGTVDDPAAAEARRLGLRATAAVPISVGSGLWGAVAVGSGGLLARDAEERLGRFAEIVGLAIQNAEAREQLAARAASDPLTALANHRTFHEALGAEAARAMRHGRSLSLVLVDLDHFKRVNVVHGHQAGDEVLAQVARRLAAVVRPGELVARVGGEEFAVILPDSDDLAAWQVAERLREAIRTHPFPAVGHMTASAGVCGLDQAGTAEELYRLADGALYWAKAHGRDVTFRYSPEVVHALSAEQRAQHLERAQALQGVRLLAQAVDAKDPLTQRHSERVADLAEELARALGWSPERMALLRQAALVHDVGKIGVPDRVLLKPGRLTSEEHEMVKGHVALTARLVADILTPEQVEWVRSHHERWDGTGYPDGLAGDDIPEGGQIISLADAWDAMTVSRPYGAPRSADDAMAECRRGSGGQWSPRLVGALVALQRSGILDPPDPDRPTWLPEGSPARAVSGPGP